MTHDEGKKVLRVIERGLKLAALEAREVAFRTHTPIIISVDGKVQKVMVTQEDIDAYKETIKDALEETECLGW